MGRPVYPHELCDQDFTWLINSFRENNPNCVLIEVGCLPLVLIRDGAAATFAESEGPARDSDDPAPEDPGVRERK